VESVYASSIEDLPLPLQEFYNRASAITIERERLHELEIEHRQSFAEREARRTSGRAVEPSERGFLIAYHDDRKRLMCAILDARSEAKLLLEHCLEQGFAPRDIPDLDQDIELFDRSSRAQKYREHLG